MAKEDSSLLKKEVCFKDGKTQDILMPGYGEQSLPAGACFGWLALQAFHRSDTRAAAEVFTTTLLCGTDFSYVLHTLELSTSHIDLIAGKFHSVSPPAEANTTLEYPSPGRMKREKDKCLYVYRLFI